MLSVDYLLSNINNIDGVGNKTAKLFKKKNINTVFDLILTLPKDFVDRRNLTKIKFGDKKHNQIRTDRRSKNLSMI